MRGARPDHGARLSSASLQARLDGFVRSISFEQADSVLIVHFASLAPARAEARATLVDTVARRWRLKRSRRTRRY